ncbi:hypothetical protein [Helicobacter trogontum]|uniref:hypothetical protein n=1 Tax=Helicobacter trogontum TaxID=50960 RepID=UPI000CF0FE55|nr:hypothetical protein [Helicobacter trogontum]
MNNNSKTLEIFELCERLSELLGDKEAIADLQKLYDKHPEMFENMKDVSHTIKEVVSNPEIIVNAKRENAILAVKSFENQNKMGEVAIENDNGTNIIFHANKKRLSEIKKVTRQVLVETPSAKAAPTWLDRCASNSNELPKCQETHSIPASSTLAQNSKHTAESTTNKLDFTQKAIEFINKQQTKYESKTIQQTHTKS